MALTPDDPHVAKGLNRFGELYFLQGRYAEAESHYKRALAIHETALGPEHPNVGVTLTYLVELYAVQGRYAEAEPLMARVETIFDKAQSQ